jgi:hypothetical protein
MTVLSTELVATQSDLETAHRTIVEVNCPTIQ